MQAIEFETDVIDNQIRIPKNKNVNMRHVRVILLTDEPLAEDVVAADRGLYFSRYTVNSFCNVDPVKYQREIRDEWE